MPGARLPERVTTIARRFSVSPAIGRVGVPMTIAELAAFVAAKTDFDTRWRLVVEFLKECPWP
jgi:hypothetical protein